VARLAYDVTRLNLSMWSNWHSATRILISKIVIFRFPISKLKAKPRNNLKAGKRKPRDMRLDVILIGARMMERDVTVNII
jgi:hypothetical protein